MANNHTRYFLALDECGNEYIVPWVKREHWFNLGVDWANAGNVPEYATKVYGGIVTFTRWEIF